MIQAGLKRAIGRCVVIVMLLMLVGATYQGVATALERHRFPRPGRMIDVGGHQLHLYCLGEGTPIVVLEAPAAGMSAAWGWVQPKVARVTRVCSYDRAGLGWSDRADSRDDPNAVAADLRTLLDRAQEPSPFVIAGQGLGAEFARLFAARFADATAALVLIDPPLEDARANPGSPLIVSPGVSPWLARVGILRATRLLSRRTAGLPPPAGGVLSAFLNRPDHLTEAARELSRWNDVTTLAAATSVSDRLPITMVDVAGRERVAFLARESDATVVTTAILETVAKTKAH